MSVSSPWTEFHDTPNKSPRQAVPRRGVVLHHAVTTSFDALLTMEMGAKEVSSTGIVKDDRAASMFNEDGAWRAWSLADAYWDSALRSVETCNESLDGYTISEASHRTLGRIVAWWAQKDGFWPHRDGDPTTWTVLGHREVYTIHGGSYATACPGAMNLGYVTKIAQEMLRGTPTPTLEDDMAGAFFRNPGGGIAYQREPNTPFISIDFPTWQGYAANGNKYVDLDQKTWDALRAKSGSATKPEPTGGGITVGDVSVDIDYVKLGAAVAKALLDEEGKRLSNG